MKKTLKFVALAAVVLMSLASSAFAESRHPSKTLPVANDWRSSRGITVEGRIADVDRERNGFVIRLDRGRYVLFADRDVDVDSVSRRRARLRDLDRGDYIRATGWIDRGGIVIVRNIELLRDDDRRYGQYDRYDRRNHESYVRGFVQDIDARREILWIRDDRTGRTIAVDADRARGRNIRRGDYVTVTGEWDRNGNFDATRIEVESRGRW